MRKIQVVLAGVLLCAAPLFVQANEPQLSSASDPVVEKGELQWFQLRESRTEVAKQLGLPKMVAPFGADFEAWQYQLGEVEEEGFSHQLVFRKSTGELISIARNYASERTVDEWFPEAETTAYFYSSPSDPKKIEYSVRVRKMHGGRLLLAMGVSRPGQVTGQIFLIRDTELAVFYPWLAVQLKRPAKP